MMGGRKDPETLHAGGSAREIGPLRDFVRAMAQLIRATDDEEPIVTRGARLLGALVANDTWLPEDYARPDPSRYQQYLLHCDSEERFSVVSFVWGPGQSTPIHDHRVWGLVGVLRGAERSRTFVRQGDGEPLLAGPEERLDRGEVAVVSPRVGDIHRVSNAFEDRVSISIHVYGANIGAVSRATYDTDGNAKKFVSGYANRTLPNLWDLSGAP
jgi:predicted metal-dependent enzyme (double-stranded beta helix superfamily)